MAAAMASNSRKRIADSFPFLQHLDISFPGGGERISHQNQVKDYNNAINLLSQKLSKLCSVDFSGNFYINDSSFLQLCINCEFLQEVLVPNCSFITHAGVAEAIHHRPTLNYFSVTDLKEAIHEVEKVNFIESMTSLKRLTCLDLSFSCINDLLLKSIALEALPLTKLVLQGCYNYTYDGISFLLSNCPSLQHLDLQRAKFLNDQRFNQLCAFLAGLVSINVSHCERLGNCGLEVLNLSHSRIDDKKLYEISKMCPRLLQLDIDHCIDVTEKGVRLAVENCTRLREINLQCCLRVSTDIVSWMIFSRPSLRKITAPPNFRLRDYRKLLSERCLVLFQVFCKFCGRA